jgi:hypothetical protein
VSATMRLVGLIAGAIAGPCVESVMRCRDRIVPEPAALAGKPIIKGIPISVEFVIDLLGRGLECRGYQRGRVGSVEKL